MDRIVCIANIAIVRHKMLTLIDECIREIVEELNAIMNDNAEVINLVYKCEQDGRFIIKYVDRTIEITYRIIDQKLDGGKKGRKEVKAALLGVIMCGMVDVNIPTGV